MKPLLVLVFLFLSIAGYSTHMRGGEIRVISINGYTCRIELRLFVNTASEIRPGEGDLDFGDGTKVTTPTVMPTILFDPRLNLGVAVYSFDHTYASPGLYRVSYTEPNLTGGILNITNSVETRFYIESQIVLSAGGSSPVMSFPTYPIFICPSGRDYVFSTAVVDDNPSGDFYYNYELPSAPPVVKNYKIPENLTINSTSGLIKWDTKFNGEKVAGLIWILVRVNKFSKDEGFQGSITRALQIAVEDSDSKISLTNSVKEENGKVLVTEGQERKVRVVLSDVKTVDSLSFKFYYNSAIKNNISIAKYDSVAGDLKYKVAVVTLKTTANVVSDAVYPVTISGASKYRVDYTFLYLTKEPPKPDPVVVTGIAETEVMQAYPNPFNSELYVNGRHAIFINTKGKVLLDTPVQLGLPVNTSDLPKGIYVVQIRNDDGTTKRIKLLRN